MRQPTPAVLAEPLQKLDRKLDVFWSWMEHTGWRKLEHLAVIFVTCLLLLWAVKLITCWVQGAVRKAEGVISEEAERRAVTLGEVVRNTARLLVAAFFVMSVLHEAGVNIGPLLAGAGVAGLAVGFGAQALVKDMISGFFLLMENQYGVGDIISITPDHTGTVERMTLRYTMVRDREGRAHYVPNGAITTVTVLSKDYANALVDVQVAYTVDYDKVVQVLREIGQELHKEWKGKVLEATEVKGVEALGATGMTLRTSTRVVGGEQWEVARELRKRIVRRFQQEGLELHFA